jgi:hypothetical protein
VDHPVSARLRSFRGWQPQKTREDFAMKSLTYATLLAFVLTPSYGFAQGSTGHNMSDEELIKLSLSAAPEASPKTQVSSSWSMTARCGHCGKEPGNGRACPVTPIRPTQNGGWPG